MDQSSQESLVAFVSRVAGYNGANRVRQAILGQGSALAVALGGRKKIQCIPSDVLVIHATPYISHGKRQLIENLTSRHGLNVQEYRLGDWRQIITRGDFIRPPYRVLPRLAFKAAVARYLIEKYRPKVAIVSTEDTIVPFLRFEINRHGGRLINIAHSIVFPSPLFAMCDFDYYFIFGQASLNSLRMNRDRFGAAKIILAGSIDLSLYRELPWEETQNNHVTYFSTWLPQKQRTAYLRQFAEVRDFALSHPDWEVLIRLHPLESPAYWHDVGKHVRNIRVANSIEPIAESVRRSCVTLCPSHSTTALDSACLGRPPIILECDEVGAQFYDSFPALKRKHGESIAMAIEGAKQNHSNYRQAMKFFLAENLAYRTDVSERMSDHISAVCEGREIAGAEELPAL